METQKKHSDVLERSSRRRHHQSHMRSKSHNRYVLVFVDMKNRTVIVYLILDRFDTAGFSRTINMNDADNPFAHGKTISTFTFIVKYWRSTQVAMWILYGFGG